MVSLFCPLPSYAVPSSGENFARMRPRDCDDCYPEPKDPLPPDEPSPKPPPTPTPPLPPPPPRCGVPTASSLVLAKQPAAMVANISVDELALMRSQAPLLAIASTLEREIKSLAPVILSSDEHPYFGSITLNVPEKKIYLFWKKQAPVPLALLKFIFKINSSRVATIEINDAVLSKSEVNEALEDFAADTSLLKTFPAASIGPAPDMSKLKVTLSANLTPKQNAVFARFRQRVTGYTVNSQNSARSSSPEAIIDILDITIDPNFKPGPTSGRWRDVAPYSAGAGYFIRGSGSCSTGFGVVRVAGSSRTNGLLTAAHCGNYRSGETVVAGDNYTTMGIFRLLDSCTVFNCRDLAYIDLGSTKVSGCVFDGAVAADKSSIYYRKAVDGAAKDYVGGYACASGAYSGVSCNIYINWVNQLVIQKPFRIIYPLTYAHKTGKPPAGNGDSGGPVFSLNGEDGVMAHGIISTQNGSTEKPCNGIPEVNGRICTSDFWWAPVEWYFSNPLNGVSLELPKPQP